MGPLLLFPKGTDREEFIRVRVCEMKYVRTGEDTHTTHYRPRLLRGQTVRAAIKAACLKQGRQECPIIFISAVSRKLRNMAC